MEKSIRQMKFEHSRSAMVVFLVIFASIGIGLVTLASAQSKLPIDLISPENGMTYETTPVFKWTNDTNSPNYVLTIGKKSEENGKYKQVYQETTSDTFATPSVDLDNGEYVWNVSSDKKQSNKQYFSIRNNDNVEQPAVDYQTLEPGAPVEGL